MVEEPEVKTYVLESDNRGNQSSKLGMASLAVVMICCISSQVVMNGNQAPAELKNLQSGRNLLEYKPDAQQVTLLDQILLFL